MHAEYLRVLLPHVQKVARHDAIYAHSTELRMLFAKIRVGLRARVIQAFNEASGELDEQSVKVIGQLLGIDAKSLGISHLIDHYREENVRLITSASQDFADDIQGVFEGAGVNGLRVEELKKKLQERVDVSNSRAELIARDQILKLNGQINKTRQEKAGVTTYTWSTSKDQRVRPEHAALEGQAFDWNNPPEVGHPGEDFQCRCVAIPVIPETDVEEGDD